MWAGQDMEPFPKASEIVGAPRHRVTRKRLSRVAGRPLTAGAPAPGLLGEKIFERAKRPVGPNPNRFERGIGYQKKVDTSKKKVQPARRRRLGRAASDRHDGPDVEEPVGRVVGALVKPSSGPEVRR